MFCFLINGHSDIFVSPPHRCNKQCEKNTFPRNVYFRRDHDHREKTASSKQPERYGVRL